MLKAIEELPDDASVEDALERLYLLYKIVRATRQWELQTISALNAIVPLQRGTVDAKRRQGYGQKFILLHQSATLHRASQVNYALACKPHLLEYSLRRRRIINAPDATHFSNIGDRSCVAFVRPGMDRVCQP